MKTDPRVDAYLQKAPAFAQPILVEARRRIQKAVPEVEETIKWNVPFFLVSGKVIASMAAFKKHVKVGVWIGSSPSFQDLASADELMPAKDFTAQLRSAVQQSSESFTSHPAQDVSAKKAPAKKVPAKKAPAKKAPPTKKSGVRSPRA